MRSGGNFNPEWGYLAPAPSFLRTARIVVVATAIGATAGAGVVLTLAGSGNTSAPLADAGKSLVVVRSMMQPVQAATTERSVAPFATTAAPVATPVVAPQPVLSNAQAEQASAQPPQANPQPPKGTLVPPPPAAQVSPPASSESRAAYTSAAPASVAALAEIPPVTDVLPVPSGNKVLFTPDQTGAAKLSGKPPAAGPASQASAAQPQAPGAQSPQAAQAPQAAGTSVKKKPEEHGIAPLLRHLFTARDGTSYYPN